MDEETVALRACATCRWAVAEIAAREAMAVATEQSEVRDDRRHRRAHLGDGHMRALRAAEDAMAAAEAGAAGSRMTRTPQGRRGRRRNADESKRRGIHR